MDPWLPHVQGDRPKKAAIVTMSESFGRVAEIGTSKELQQSLRERPDRL